MEWPYIAPRVEFMLSGFANEKHLFMFEQVPMKYTAPITETNKEGVITGHGARCAKCGTVFVPTDGNLKDHGRLHLAVDMATRQLQARIAKLEDMSHHKNWSAA